MMVMNADCEQFYAYVERYARENRYENTLTALPQVKEIISCTGELTDSYFEDSGAQFRHCLDMTRMIIDLHIPLSPQDEDVLLSAALCHILPEREMAMGLDVEVYRILNLIRRVDFLDPEKRAQFIGRVEGERLALLLRIADQANFAGQFHRASGWRTRKYIYETRNVYLPMCIYAEEHYPELGGTAALLMEKMLCLTEAAEILQSRYELRESELTQEIFALREENARIRGALRDFRKEMEA